MKFFATTIYILTTVLTHPLSAAYFGNGMKIGEVNQGSAIIWTRLTQTPQFNMQGHMFIEFEAGKDKEAGTKKAAATQRVPNWKTWPSVLWVRMGMFE